MTRYRVTISHDACTTHDVEAALAAAHDDLSSQCAVGTNHQVQVARLVPGVEVMRSLPHSVRYLAERAIESLRDALYDEIGGNAPLVEKLSPEQLQQVGRAILETIAATDAIVGKGLDLCAEHTVVIA